MLSSSVQRYNSNIPIQFAHDILIIFTWPVNPRFVHGKGKTRRSAVVDVISDLLYITAQVHLQHLAQNSRIKRSQHTIPAPHELPPFLDILRKRPQYSFYEHFHIYLEEILLYLHIRYRLVAMYMSMIVYNTHLQWLPSPRIS